ncbi:MAG TPA: hypothetical protein QF624_10510 [Dehalococcoidia bacterium]|nr:hypothetical protein [Dehalococcoidia bacterium]
MTNDAFASLTLAEVEEASGELHRRVAIALRSIGERRADERGEMGTHADSPRQIAAALAASLELAASTLGAVAANVAPVGGRIDRHPTTVAAVMYAAPTIGALLARLEQDRRLLASTARTLESRLDEQHATPWGTLTLRGMVTEIALTVTASSAQELEQRAPVDSI